MLTRARILLLSDEGLAGSSKSDAQIVSSLGVCSTTVASIRKRFAQEGLESALQERPRPGQPIKFDGNVKAHLMVLACTDPPEGHARWTLRMLADKAVEVGLVESLSHETVRQVLKKTN
jgi:transposase